jgi:hypothetical protein
MCSVCRDFELIDSASAERVIALKQNQEVKLAERDEKIAIFTSHFNEASKSLSNKVIIELLLLFKIYINYK